MFIFSAFSDDSIVDPLYEPSSDENSALNEGDENSELNEDDENGKFNEDDERSELNDGINGNFIER